METAYVSLDALPGDGPVATDNPPPGAAAPSPGTASSAAAPAGGEEVTRRIAELEAVVNRQRQQIDGSRQEATRLASEVERLRQQQTTPPPATAPPAAVTRPPKTRLLDAVQRYNEDGDASALEAWEQEVLSAAQGQYVSREDVQRMVQEAQGQGQSRQSLQTAITQRHPELLSDPEFTTAVGTRYQALMQDPLAQSLYPADEQYLVVEPSTQIKYDMRVLLQAANEVKASRGATPRQTPTMGAPQGGTTRPAQTGPAIPRALISPNGVLSDPRVQAALRTIGWGTTMREQATTLTKHMSPQSRQRWARGQA